MATETSLPWPSSIPELKRLDELLRCGICYEFMSTSMVTVCSHNFCSMCIRQYLGYKTQCPACFQETTGQQLRNNRLLDEIILLFPRLRDKTARQCQSSKGYTISGYLTKEGNSNDESGSCSADVNLVSPESNNVSKKEFSSTPSNLLSNELLGTPRASKSSPLIETPKRSKISTTKSPLLSSSSACNSRVNNSIFNSKSSVRSPSTLSATQSPSTSASLSQSGRQSASGFFSILGDKSGNDNATDEPKVPCPVCNVCVPERNINLHLDACLKRMEEGEAVEIVNVKETPKRKPLPKLVYSLLSDKQLRQMLKEIGLSFQGDKHHLSNRHRRYTTLYNVECDAAEPRPVQELIRQVEREEKEETKGTTSKSIFTYDRKTPVDIIEKEQVNYLKKNDSHFANLIADVKKRQEEAKKKKSMKEKADVHSEEKIDVPSTSKVKLNPSSKNKRNHYLSSSDNESDTECSKGKTLKKGTEKNKSILNFFQNSPKKTVSEKSGASNYVSKPGTFNLVSESGTSNRVNENFSDDLMNSDDDDFFSQNLVITNGDESLPSENGDNPLVNNNANTEKQEIDICNAQSKEKLEEEPIKPSPDIFIGSPARSEASDASVSLLQDQQIEEEEVIPTEAALKEGVDNDSEDDLIPGRQPESCPLDSQPERSPSPSIGKRVTRNSKSSSQPPQPDLSDLGPETQDLDLDVDSQGDPEYQPSQLLDALDYEEVPPLTRKSRRNNRKRQESEEPVEAPRSRRRRK